MSDLEEIENLLSEDTNILVIGDPHFKYKNIQEGKAFVEAVCASAESLTPTAIVILGDVLDTHEVVRIQPYNLAFQFIKRMAAIAPTYVLVGNHDYINNSQFLTENHIFNPLKEIDNIFIIDTAKEFEIGGKVFVMCPYVPPGRFTEALNTLVPEESTLDEYLINVTCVFAHQEFKGCRMGAIVSEMGDEWPEFYPSVVSGHIHDSQIVGNNVYYPGSSMQHAFSESPDKRLWYITWTSNDCEQDLTYEKIDLGLKGKKTIYLDVKEVDKFNMSLVEYYTVKLVIKGTSEELKLFRKGKAYSNLINCGVKISSKPQELIQSEEMQNMKVLATHHIDFGSIFKEIVSSCENKEIQKAYEDIIGPLKYEVPKENEDTPEENDNVEYELVFQSNGNEEEVLSTIEEENDDEDEEVEEPENTEDTENDNE